MYNIYVQIVNFPVGFSDGRNRAFLCSGPENGPGRKGVPGRHVAPGPFFGSTDFGGCTVCTDCGGGCTVSIVSIFSNWSEHHETSSWLKFGSILERSERTEKKKRFRFGFRHFGSKRLKKRAIVRESDPKEEKRKRGWGCLVFGFRKGLRI